MFNFRLFNTEDGNQIIDRILKTPYDSLTPLQMLEYMEIDNQLAFMERMEKKQRREAERDSGKLPKILYGNWLVYVVYYRREILNHG